MDRYFSLKITDQPFVMFSKEHLTALAILGAINIILILWFKKRKSSRMVQDFGYWLAGLIFLSKLLFIFWCICSGAWFLDYSLPLNLCDIAAFLCIIMLIFNNYSSFEIAYFLSLGGCLQALVTPDLAYSFPHFMFINFFISHSAILTAVFYMIIVKDFIPTLKSILKMFAFTNLCLVAAAAANILTGGNYMFLCRKPEGVSIIDLLGPWPWYILSLEGIGLLISFLCYLPFASTKFISKKDILFKK